MIDTMKSRYDDILKYNDAVVQKKRKTHTKESERSPTNSDRTDKIYHNQKRKAHRHKGLKKHSKHSDSDDAVSKKHKKKHKKHKSKDSSGNNKNAWGTYGVLQDCDLWVKRPEFQLWLLEIKKENLEMLPSWKERELFREYIEDYNTCTFPHEKYYSLAAWEKKRYSDSPDSDNQVSSIVFNDEELRRKEIHRLREKFKLDEQQCAYNSIRKDSEKIEAMRHQHLLQTQMKTLFRMGHIAEAEKIRDRLRIEEE
ncbi:uncharacterized protein LOC128883134 isoform X2 [Hylaeus volcanicus]|uniref:uncharacterized protein LOC128883134 isoform X2 n=1 Tax=Hylaeus volcanicus TaxID=313075 RepID=UPI0023B79633|nr:uncharacterized protein LOC128883134 isoform X2 [Hylaeus volcanicus]